MGRLRPLLLASSALLAPALTLAQAPDARPVGGRVVAGAAGIAQTPGRTQVTQSTDRAVIEWRGFDIGAGHQVDIRQPSAGSWSLQRVTGPDPSAIAGRLTSNGGVALVNPNGVVFQNGAQVDVAALIATTADTTNQAFMAGRMAFDRPGQPGARVENRGTITVREQGLAALVGPVAANSGTINARLGRVAIAGAEAVTLDLAGDGLLTLDVTRQVTRAPDGAVALATNSGTIRAEGGQVLLTAEAASGLLEAVVSAGGGITAGRITANAPGGGVAVPDGALLEAPGGRVTVGAAANSRIGAPERLSARSSVARGAAIRAPGGEVIVHAAERTAMHGTVSAPGGQVEVSSRRALALDGTMEGAAILVDPQELRIVGALSGSAEPAEITAAAVAAATGALTLTADRTIRVEAATTKPSGPLTLATTNATAAPGEGIQINRPLNVAGDLTLRSAGDITQAASGARLTAGTLLAESTRGAVRLEASDNVIRALAGGAAATRFDLASSVNLPVDGAVAAPEMRLTTRQRLTLNAPLAATGTLELVGQRGIAQAAGGAAVTAGRLMLESAFGPVTLAGEGNRVTELGDVTAPFGLVLRNAASLNLAGVLNGGGAEVALTLDAGDLTQDPAASRLFAERLVLDVPGGGVTLDGGGNSVARLSGGARDALVLQAGRGLTLDGRVAAARVALTAFGELAQETGALLVTPRLEARAIGGAVSLQDPLNEIAALGPSGAATAFALATAGSLVLDGLLAAPEVQLTAGGGVAQGLGAIVTPRLGVNALTGAVALAGAGNEIGTLGPSGAAGGFALATTGALRVAGALDAGGALRLQAGAIELGASLVAPSVTLIAGAGGIVQGAGTLRTAALRAEATEGVRLDAAGNAIAAVSGRAGPLFRVATEGALAADDIAAAEVALRAGGDLTQPGGLGIAAGLLAAGAGGRLDLSAAANAIRALGPVAAPGGLALRSTTALTLTEAITVPNAVFTIAGDLDQLPAAPLSAGALTLAAGGAVRLENPGNDLPRLLGATAGGDLALGTSGGLTLEGGLRAGGTARLSAMGDLIQAAGLIEAPVLVARSVGGGVTLEGANLLGAAGGGAAGAWRLRTAGLGNLTLAGLVAAPEVALSLGGGLLEGGGALRAEALALGVAGAVVLEGASHRVGALSGRAGALRLAAGGPLQVTGALAIAGDLALSADGIALLAPVAAGGAAYLAAIGGDIAQSAAGAGLSAATLELRAAGAVAMAGAGNLVPRLVGGSAGGAFALAAEGPLRLAGALAGETVALRSTGALTLDGAGFVAGRAVLIAAPGGLAAGTRSVLEALDPARLPVLVIDTRGAGLLALPDYVQADLPGLAAAAQPTQLALFGPASGAAAGGAAFDIAAGASPVFLLLDAGPAVGTLKAGRLGLLGAGGTAFLVGTLGGIGGEAAAALVARSGSGGTYSFNACPMGVANCGATTPPVDPPVDPPPVTPPVDPPVTPPVTPPVQPPVDPPVTPPPRPAGAAALPPVRLGLSDLEETDPDRRRDEPSAWAPWPPPWPLPPLVTMMD
jgi:filamentous hemagglutinin family protein